MPSIRVRESDSFVLSEVKKREHYEKPSVKKKKKAIAARKKAAKRVKLGMR
jgi:small subunit ribosomal protein S21